MIERQKANCINFISPECSSKCPGIPWTSAYSYTAVRSKHGRLITSGFPWRVFTQHVFRPVTVRSPCDLGCESLSQSPRATPWWLRMILRLLVLTHYLYSSVALSHSWARQKLYATVQDLSTLSGLLLLYRLTQSSSHQLLKLCFGGRTDWCAMDVLMKPMF